MLTYQLWTLHLIFLMCSVVIYFEEKDEIPHLCLCGVFLFVYCVSVCIVYVYIVCVYMFASLCVLGAIFVSKVVELIYT